MAPNRPSWEYTESTKSVKMSEWVGRRVNEHSVRKASLIPKPRKRRR